MSKAKYKNVSRSFRTMRRCCTEAEALAWIGHYSQSDRIVIEKVYGIGDHK